jgi:hypothetical protein
MSRQQYPELFLRLWLDPFDFFAQHLQPQPLILGCRQLVACNRERVCVSRNRAGSRRYRSESARTAFSSVIRASKAAIRPGSRSSAPRSLKFIRRGRLRGNSLVCVAGRDRLVFRVLGVGEPRASAARCESARARRRSHHRWRGGRARFRQFSRPRKRASTARPAKLTVSPRQPRRLSHGGVRVPFPAAQRG